MNPHAQKKATLYHMTVGFWLNRGLIWQMTKREVVGRYKGSFFGLLWSVINPVLMLLIFTFVFGVVLKARWNIDTTQGFAVVLFIGLILHALLSDCLINSPNLITNNVNYVKKVVFPLEALALVQVLSSFINFTISVIILFIALMILGNEIYITWIFFPLIVIPLVLVCLGITLLFSSLGVYLRDVGQLTGFLSTVLLFVSPIFIPIDSFPEDYRFLIDFNPLTFIVNGGREVLLLGKGPDTYRLIKYFFITIIFLQFSYWWFMRTKKGFADVL